MTVVYLDAVFAYNLLTDYLLLLTAARLAGGRLHRLRYALAAALGGLYAVLCFLPCGTILRSGAGKLLAAAALVAAAYGWERGFLRRLLLFLAVSCAFGGLELALAFLSGGERLGGAVPVPFSDGLFLLSVLLCTLLLGVVFRGACRHRERGALLRAELRCHGETLCLSALADTGNTLSDPLSGAPVLIVPLPALLPLLTAAEADTLRDACENPLLLREGALRLRFLPFESVGGSGLLPAFRLEQLNIEGKEIPDALVAVTPRFFGEGRVQALWGGAERGDPHQTKQMGKKSAGAAGMAGAAAAAGRILHRRKRYAAAPAGAGEGGGAAGAAGDGGGQRTADADRAQSASGGLHRPPL